MLDSDIRARLIASAAEYDRLADAAGVENIAMAVDARQSGRDIRAALLAADNDVPAGQLSYAQMRAAMMQNQRLLIFLVLQGGTLRLTAETTKEHGADVISGFYQLISATDSSTADFMLDVVRTGKPS
jgi:hypothetical protein